ncbi:MAG TPA: glycogen synthase GlgA [Methylomusa anaerophila]|uniref:Glycogen synthase n=1 Tax=Methylomusa anaerophila TaxID=1930071 RepID=A0A348AJ48_9FIRM|nr:glycogen synthase GlgA [Methylomusa anaerophila]BBB91096.1 glycogen synthase [Methylomusa anaerophila]HML88973.1 glycogen synthase GlgA [Methylomusa anaerophila]
MRSVLFVAAEAHPFIKTGGLGDAVGSLPQELKKQGVEVRVILPKHDKIPAHWREQMIHLKTIYVPLGWRNQYCGIEMLEYNSVTYYFIDNEYYFKRSGLYDCYDDAERFAYFCRAVLESLPYLNFEPQVLHCHDWHTAILPVLLAAHYQHKPGYSQLRTMLTIHNILYQGVFDSSIMGDILELNPAEYFTGDKLEFYGQVNFLKAGIVYTDVITTVSPAYAREIVTLEGGRQLDDVLRQRQHDIYGILNGIDNDLYNPANDKIIFQNYTWDSVEQRSVNKTRLQEYLSLPVNPDVPMIALVSQLINFQGIDLVTEILDDLMAMDLQLVVMGKGDEDYENVFQVAAHHYPAKLSANIFDDETLARRIFAAGDLYLMPSLAEPCGTNQLVALRYGCVPLVRETGGLQNTVRPYNEFTGEGNGFSFIEYSVRNLMHAIERAIGFYHEPKVWPQIVTAAMKSDVGWSNSAIEYRDLYDLLVK